MPYSSFVLVALVIHVLINIDIFTKKDHIVAIQSYRFFLISIALFYVTDILWGVFQSYGLATILYIDTFIYFIMMGATIMFWTRFVIRYLEGNKIFSNVVRWIGILFFLTEISLLIANFFQPLLFTVDEKANYTAYVARDAMLYAQIAMYSLITIYSLIFGFIKKSSITYRRYIAIILFSIVMITCIAIQISDPLIPLYSIGCLVGICILNSFAIGDTKEKYKVDFQNATKIKEEKEHQLDEYMTIAYRDALTGVKSRYAFVEKEETIDKLISKNEIDEFVVILFDLNGLKQVNDTKGHKEGDKYINESVKIIESYFPVRDIYRYGGDEFVVILEGEDITTYANKHNDFMRTIENNIGTDKPIVSSGISRYKKGSDFAFKSVFARADKMMYARKIFLKESK